MTAGAMATYILASVLSNEPASLKVDLNEYTCLVEAIHFEAKGEDYDGKKAVANVVLNRVSSDRFPSSICGVVKQRYQFSYRNSGKPTLTLQNSIEEESFEETAHIAYHAVNGDLPDNTNGADHYYAHDKVTPFWIDAAEYTLTIGNHTFAKL